MKKILLVLGIGVASFAAVAQQQNGLERIIVEKYYISDENDQQCDEGELPAGSVTYRIY
jgi:neutral trehalase